MVDIVETILWPLFATFGALLGGLGALGFGLVFGAVMRSVVYREETNKWLLPVVFVAAALVFFVADSIWAGSPGTLGMVGIGLFVGFLFLKGKGEIAED
jgi:F0F1-type ATP synthase membrane subunit c/vacuolar-type H+-ATPase subunit K